MTAHATVGRQRRDLGDRVDHAMREGRRRSHHDGCPFGQRGGQFVRINPELIVDRDTYQRHVEEPGGLVKRRVRGDRRDDLRRGDAAALAGEVPVGLHRQQDALGPARNSPCRPPAFRAHGRDQAWMRSYRRFPPRTWWRSATGPDATGCFATARCRYCRGTPRVPDRRGRRHRMHIRPATCVPQPMPAVRQGRSPRGSGPRRPSAVPRRTGTGPGRASARRSRSATDGRVGHWGPS